MTKYWFWVFGIGLLFGILTVNKLDIPKLKPTSDPKTSLQQVEKIFTNTDPEVAYKIFVDLYAQSTDQINAHNLAHWVGEFLYKEKGIEGISVCDDQFNYGCYHGFYGRAFSQEGAELVPIAQSACESKSNSASKNGCIHGIGHGILAYFGYTETDLVKALELCDSLEGKSGQDGCYNGVLMEYNTRLMQAGQARSRELTEEGELEPCRSLANPRYRSACYFEQPAWWASARIPLDRYYPMCTDIVHVLDQDSCKAGVFRMAPVIAMFDVSKTQAFCMTIPDNDKYLCTIKSGEVLLANHSLNASSICDIMESTRVAECQDYLSMYKCEVLGICQ